jgi:hypothetical protein
MIKQLLRRLGITKAPDTQQAKRPRILPPGHQKAVEENLRRKGLRIERRNSHIPVWSAGQFDREVAASETAHLRRFDDKIRRVIIEKNDESLR